MRLRSVAGCSLSLLLVGIVSATAQQPRALTCTEREQQIKSAADDVTRLTAETDEKRTECRTTRRSCDTYTVALSRQREGERSLQDLTEDPAWRRCPASAATRYAPAGTTRPTEDPGSTRTGGQNPRDGASGSARSSTGTSGYRSGSDGYGAGRGYGGGSGSQGGSAEPVSYRGSSDMPPRVPKGGTSHGQTVSAKLNTNTGWRPPPRPGSVRPHVSQPRHARISRGGSGGHGRHSRRR
jgi:hypothetical protein